jgi:phosphoenolpyruvate-protein kinase (PTS system EI component)
LDSPLAWFAPLLWTAAAIVTRRGGTGAHLFDVARSLGVAAVCGCDLGQPDEIGDALIAVDGTSGSVWLLGTERSTA